MKHSRCKHFLLTYFSDVMLTVMSRLQDLDMLHSVSLLNFGNQHNNVAKIPYSTTI